MADTNLPSTNTPPGIGTVAPTTSTIPNPQTPVVATKQDTSTIIPPSTTGMDTNSYMNFMNNLNGSLQQNNQLVTQKNLIQKQLFDQPLSQEEIKQLPPEMRSVIQGNNQDQMKLQLKIINDTLQGRNDSVAKSIGFLTTSYTENQKNVQSALAQLETYATNNGLKLGDLIGTMAPILGKDVADQLAKNLADLKYPYIKSGLQSVTGGAGSYAVNIPSGTIASQTNNPLNIKFSATSPAGGRDSGVAGQDGGTFAAFNSASDGLQAGIKLLKSDVYSNLTVDQAMKKWSNSGYGAEVSSSLNPNQTISSLSDSQLQQLVTDMAKRESGASVTASVSDAVQGMLNIYKTTGTIPPLGRLAQSERDQFYAAVAGGGIDMIGTAAMNKAIIAGSTTALRTQTNQYAANITSIGTLDKQLGLVKQYSDKVDRSGSPVFNKYLLYLKGQVAGDADTAAFQNIINTASAEFAKILSGSSASIAGATVSSQEDAKTLLNASMTQGQLESVIDLMKSESNYRLQSQKESIETLKTDISNIGKTGTTQTDYATQITSSIGAEQFSKLKSQNPGVSDADLYKGLKDAGYIQ